MGFWWGGGGGWKGWQEERKEGGGVVGVKFLRRIHQEVDPDILSEEADPTGGPMEGVQATRAFGSKEEGYFLKIYKKNF